MQCWLPRPGLSPSNGPRAPRVIVGPRRRSSVSSGFCSGLSWALARWHSTRRASHVAHVQRDLTASNLATLLGGLGDGRRSDRPCGSVLITGRVWQWPRRGSVRARSGAKHRLGVHLCALAYSASLHCEPCCAPLAVL